MHLGSQDVGSLHLQRLSANDTPQLIALMREIYPPAYAHLWEDACKWYFENVYAPETVAKELSTDAAPAWFIVVDEVPIGFLRIRFDWPLPEEPEKPALQVQRLYFHTDFQGVGVGKTVLGFVEALAQSRGDKILWLEAMDTQQQALRFYEKHGFEKCGAFILDYPGIIDHMRGMYRMMKRVDTAGK